MWNLNTNNKIKFKPTILNSGFCDYSDACILANETIADAGQRAYAMIETLNK